MDELTSDLRVRSRMSRDEYRRWSEQQESGRYERVDGMVVRMPPERVGHAKRKALIWLALRQSVAASGLPCGVYPDGVGIEVGDNDFEPDAMVGSGSAVPDNATVVPDPLVIVEVLSPSTRHVDLTHKLAAYFQLPSPRHYLIFWADQPQVVHHRRKDDGSAIDTTMLIQGAIHLDPPGIVLQIEDIYAD